MVMSSWNAIEPEHGNFHSVISVDAIANCHVAMHQGNADYPSSLGDAASLHRSYAVYHHKIRKRLAAQIGLYVPRDVFEKAESDFKAKRAKIEENLWRDLDKSYPLIPFADKNKLHRLISSQYPNLTGKSALDHSGITIYAYVRDRYTPFKSLAPYDENRDTEAIARAHQRVQEIIASWRGERSKG